MLDRHGVNYAVLTSNWLKRRRPRADTDALDARLMRNGYNVKSLCDLLNSKPREITAFIHGQLPPERTQQLSSQLLAGGLI
jgi:hypothetical protein